MSDTNLKLARCYQCKSTYAADDQHKCGKSKITRTSINSYIDTSSKFNNQESVIITLLAEDSLRMWTRLEVSKVLQSRGYAWAIPGRVSARVNKLIKSKAVKTLIDKETGHKLKVERRNITTVPSEAIILTDVCKQIMKC